jgi:hypothetical protein
LTVVCIVETAGPWALAKAVEEARNFVSFQNGLDGARVL